ncbi:MAG: hypothetical protein LBG62_00765 [Candidatus Methanoplasma sp.]|jgi:nitroreductase|nr:hypothetical protein [Candidatus Methanoplasma sp.]
MSLYDQIFARRSVRRYDADPLSERELGEAEGHLKSIGQLPGQSARFEVVSGSEVKGGHAPHAILACADGGDASLANIGYALQEADLWLQSKGYGSLWCGMARPRAPRDGYRVMLEFGRTSEPPRSGEAEFRRRPAGDVSNEDNAVARAARLAPSALNAMPWELEFSPGKVSVRRAPRGAGRIFAANLQRIDVGIAARHVALALAHEGIGVSDIGFAGPGGGFAVEFHLV